MVRFYILGKGFSQVLIWAGFDDVRHLVNGTMCERGIQRNVSIHRINQ
jgi:hypothetical protein